MSSSNKQPRRDQSSEDALAKSPQDQSDNAPKNPLEQTASQAQETAESAQAKSQDPTQTNPGPATLEERESNWGTIFVQGQEHVLGGVEAARSTYWTEADETAYLQRVRDKATKLAAEIVQQARQEADTVRENARQEGYNHGLEQAQEELENFRSGMAESAASVLSAIEQESASLFEQCHEDISAIAKLAVEKTTGILLAEERTLLLSQLLSQAMALMEQHRLLTIFANPEDEPLIQDIVSSVKERFPEISTWQVKADTALSPGSLVLENESSLAESLSESRLAAVNEILTRLAPTKNS